MGIELIDAHVSTTEHADLAGRHRRFPETRELYPAPTVDENQPILRLLPVLVNADAGAMGVADDHGSEVRKAALQSGPSEIPLGAFT